MLHTRRVVIGLMIAGAAVAGAQQVPDRGALAIVRGADTIVVDRFAWTGDTLEGVAQVLRQPKLAYRAVLGPNDAVRWMSLGVLAPDAPLDASPAQRARLVVDGDTIVVYTAAGVQHIASHTGAIPMVNNALALMELFTRRARASGGVANIPYFVSGGPSAGKTLDVAVRPVSGDSLTVTIAGQVQRFEVDGVGRILGGTIQGTGMRFVRLGAAAAAGLAVDLRDTALAPKTDYSAPPGAPYSAEEVRIDGPSGVLGGTLTEPRGGRGPLPAVVTITGSGQQDRDEYIPFAGGIRLFRQVADTLSRRGIAVLRLDDRGVGASRGSAATATTADFADDIRAAIAYLRTRKDIDPARIGVVGHSEGGAIALMIAAADPHLAAAVIMAGPGEPGIDISMAQNRYAVEQDSTLSPAAKDSVLRAARASLDPSRQTIPWLKYWLAFDPAPFARKVRAPTLIVQGATDKQVDPENATKLAALLRAGGDKDVTVDIVPNTNHLFVADSTGNFNMYDKLATNRVSAAVLGPLADWLSAHLRPRR
ncbi:MAG TPA: alpha/beta fold hydrolase [Gemmatimonadaceae bacterium]|nr:alpha/beta fold hydrolase [Gemmatimonadaceae bacterium]